MMKIMIVILVALGGLLAGSFLTAFVGRLKSGQDFVKTRSCCDSCQKRLKFRDLVPILSWVFLKGRCRYCLEPINWTYPLIEIVSTLVFLLFYWFWPLSLTGGQLILFLIWQLVLVGFLALSIFDLRWRLLPNKIIYPLFGLALILLLVRFLLAGDNLNWGVVWSGLGSILIGGGVLYGLFYFYLYFRKQELGFGDVRLGFLLGILLFDWRLSFMMIFLAAVLSSVISIPILFYKQRNQSTPSQKLLKAYVPFGPFLMGASLLTLWFGDYWWAWYLQLTL